VRGEKFCCCYAYAADVGGAGSSACDDCDFVCESSNFTPRGRLAVPDEFSVINLATWWRVIALTV
jgi:hypothetical protein